MLGSVGSSNVSFSGNDTDEYPDPARYNLTDRQDQLLFMQRYQIAQRHDPQLKFAVLIFYVTIVSGRSSAAAGFHNNPCFSMLMSVIPSVTS